MSTGPTEHFEAVLESQEEEAVVLATTTNSDHLHLVVESEVSLGSPGDRISGTAHARALKVHQAGGGGAFIEPVSGQPRIVAGRVLRNNGSGEVLVRSAIPFVVTVRPGKDRDACVPGTFVNFHVESGVIFRPDGTD